MIYQPSEAEIYRVASRLIKEQFILFEFCLYMLGRSSKMACKKSYGKTLDCQDIKLMLFALPSLAYHAINHETLINHLLTYSSMLEGSKDIKNNLKMLNTYLIIQA